MYIALGRARFPANMTTVGARTPSRRVYVHVIIVRVTFPAGGKSHPGERRNYVFEGVGVHRVQRDVLGCTSLGRPSSE